MSVTADPPENSVVDYSVLRLIGWRVRVYRFWSELTGQGLIRNWFDETFFSFLRTSSNPALYLELTTFTKSHPVMPNYLSLLTTVGEFHDFLDGGFVAAYGDTGTTVVHALRTAIQLSVYDALGKALRERSPEIPIDEFQFLRDKVFPTLRYTSIPSAIPSRVGGDLMVREP